MSLPRPLPFKRRHYSAHYNLSLHVQIDTRFPFVVFPASFSGLWSVPIGHRRRARSTTSHLSIGSRPRSRGEGTTFILSECISISGYDVLFCFVSVSFVSIRCVPFRFIFFVSCRVVSCVSFISLHITSFRFGLFRSVSICT